MRYVSHNLSFTNPEPGHHFKISLEFLTCHRESPGPNRNQRKLSSNAAVIKEDQVSHLYKLCQYALNLTESLIQMERKAKIKQAELEVASAKLLKYACRRKMAVEVLAKEARDIAKWL